MKSIPSLVITTCLAIGAAAAENWLPLFNGKDLDGWTMKFADMPVGENHNRIFRVEDGLLKVSYADSEKFDGRFGHLFYKTPYSHYRIRGEFRFTGDQLPGGPDWAFRNNGFMLHSQPPETMTLEQKFPNSIEMQFWGNDPEKGERFSGRPMGNLFTPGTKVSIDGKDHEGGGNTSSSPHFSGLEWVTVEAEVRGNEEIIHRVNGQEVLRYQNPRLDDGTPLTSGYIAIQAETHPTEFRKIELLPLEGNNSSVSAGASASCKCNPCGCTGDSCTCTGDSCACVAGSLEQQFSALPMAARRLTGPLFWLHGDENESQERLETYLEKVAEGGNGSFTAESRPHLDWLGPKWFDDLEICLNKAKQLDLEMWIFDERWWPSQSIGGTVPARYAAKSLVAEAMDADGPAIFESTGFGGERYIGAVAGRLTEDNRFEGDSLLDLAPYIQDGNLSWQPPRGKWRVVRFSHKQAPGLGQRGGKELSVDGASRESTEWFLKTVYQPHHDRFKDDFGTTIPGFFYDEPETVGDWGSELNVILNEWGVDWKKAYIGYKFQLAGDDDAAARYQYMEAIAEAWGRVMYGGMSEWCRQRGVKSIGHFMEHGMLYVDPKYCAGDLMRLQRYSDMGGIDLVVKQMYPGQRPHDIYQTPKLGSSISHVYGKQDDIAMCEIFGGYNQQLTYPEMKWLTDQHQVRGINFMIPHSFNPKAPYDRDYPPYFYNDGHEPRWPLYRVWADYTSRLSLMLTGGHHVCPVAILFSGNARRVGHYVTPEDMTTVLQDALYDCDWLPFEAFENSAAVDGKDITLHGERYQVLIVPPTDVITQATLAKAKTFFEQGGVVIGYGHLPSKSGTLGTSSAEIANLRNDIWGDSPRHGTAVCRTSAAGGRSYFLPEKPDVAMITAVLHKDAGVPPVVEVLKGSTDHWLHVLHRVKDEQDVFLVCNQDHVRGAKTFELKFKAAGFPEIWDSMRNTMQVVPFTRDGPHVVLPLTLEPMESVLVVFNQTKRTLPPRITAEALASARIIPVTGGPVPPPAPPRPLMDPSPNGKLTLSPVVGNPFEGSCQVPADLDLASARLLLVMDGIAPEEAARVFINGESAGGFIGKPTHLEVARFLKHGENTIRIEPFAPKSVKLVMP